MMRSLAWLVCGLLAACAADSGSVFPEGREVQYAVILDVSSGSEEPVSALSYFGINAKLRVQAKSNNQAIFQLADIKYTVYNGPGTRKNPTGDVKSIPVPQESESVYKPFSATFAAGQVTGIQFEKSEVSWSKNFKRALVAQFQVNFEQLTKNLTTPHIFISSENGISGECKINYLVLNSNENNVEFRKFSEGSKCSKTSYSLDFYPETYAENKFEDSVSSSTERNYKLVRSGDKLLIDSIMSRNVIAFQPFGEHGESQYHVTKQRLKQVREGPILEPLAGLSDPKVTSLEFELPAEKTEGADFDVYMGAWGKTQDQIVKEVIKKFYSLAEKLDMDGNLKRSGPPELLIAINQMRSLGREDLSKIADTILTVKSFTEETAQNIFLDAFPQVGTRASLLTSFDLLQKMKMQSNKATLFVTKIPFYFRNVGPEIFEDAKILLNIGEDGDALQRNGVLAFSTLVGTICKNKKCEPSVLDEYVRMMFSKLRESSDYGDQLLYLEALGNIEIGSVAEYLEPLIRGELGYSHHLRFRAALITRNTFKTQSSKVQSTYWPILANRSEHLELRCAAVLMLLTSQPSTENFLNVLWFMTAETNSHLYNFYFTTVQSLLTTSQPYYMKLAPDAAKLAKLIPKPNNDDVATINTLIDYKEDKLGISGLCHVMAIGDETTGVPNVFSFGYVSKSFDTFTLDGTMFLRLEGLNDVIKKDEDLDLGSEERDLQKLLNILKVTRRTSSPLDIEIIIQKQGQTIMCVHLNDTVAQHIVAAIAAIMVPAAIKDFHSNYQHVDQALMREILQPSDIGFGVSMQQMAPYLFSQRTHLTQPEQVFALAKQFKSVTEYSEHITFNMRTVNPFGVVVQGISRSITNDMKLSLSLTASLDLAQNSLKLRMDWEPGKQIYVHAQDARTKTFIVGEKSETVLNQTCPECPSRFLVSQGEEFRKDINVMREKIIASEIEVANNLIDCEGENHIFQNKGDLWEILVSSKEQNEKYEDTLITGMIAAQHAMIQPVSSGTCGFVFEVSSVGQASNAELALKAEIKDDKILLRGLLNVRDKEDKVLRTWDSNLIIEHSEEENDHLAFKARLTRQVPDQKPYAICLKMENKYPERNSPWETLYHPDSISETHHSFALEFGESEQTNKCPSNGTQIIITGSTSTGSLDPELWPLEQCERDRGDKQMYPATFACGETMKLRNLARNFTFKVRQNNISPKLKSVFSHVSALQHLMGIEVIEIPKDFTLNVEDTQREGVAINLVTQDGTSVNYAKILPEHVSEDLASAMSYLATYPSFSELSMAIDRSDLCAVAGNTVMTFDNATINWPQDSNYKLLAADCHADTFGVFGRNQPGSESIDLQIYILNDLIEVKQGKGDEPATFSVNGTTISETSVAFDELSISWRGSFITIEHDDLDLEVHSSPSSVAIITTTQTCGICGDHNEDPEVPGLYPGPEGPISTQADYIAAYTLP